VQRFHASGAKHGEPILLGDSLPAIGIRNATHGVDLVATPDGGFVASFVQTAGNSETVYARQYDATATPSADGPVVTGGRIARQADDVGENVLPIPALATDGAGHFAVAYSDVEDLSADLRRLGGDAAFTDGSLLSVHGAAGDDTITVALDGANLIVTRNGQSQSFAAADIERIQIDGAAGDDSITNDTALPCTVEGGDGNDTVYGGSGDDRIDGGAGDDSLWGQGGNDRLAGDDGFDSLYGGGGNDRAYGGLQGDFIRGNAGRDHLYGNGGNDRIYGGASADSLYGQGGNDQLFGEGGNDHLYADYAAGRSTLHGNAGDDTLISANNLADQVFGDGGHDSATADASDLLTSIENALA